MASRGCGSTRVDAIGMIPGGMGDDFSDFYREAYPGAVRLAWLLTHDHAAAEDVVQDAFVRLRPASRRSTTAPPTFGRRS